ncbi:hypothetical protein B0H17DRAFT_925803, partial [Mycena rosella]
HRREGHLLTQTQEEMLLVFCFGLFWMAALLGWRALRAQGGHPSSSAGQMLEPAGISGQAVRPYPCSIDDVYCVVEDYTFF